MLNSSYSRWRTFASSAPSGILIALIIGARIDSATAGSISSLRISRMKSSCTCWCRCQAVLQSFFEHDAQRFVQGIVHRDRRGVMVDPLAAPVFLDHRQIEIPALHFGLAVANHFDGPFVERHRRQARRAAETFLRAAVAGIDAQLVDPHRRAAERSDGVDQQQTRRFHEPSLAISSSGCKHAGRSLRVHHRGEFILLLRQRGSEFLRVERRAPLRFDGVDLRRRSAAPRRPCACRRHR